MIAIEEVRRVVPWWVVWLPALYPLFGYALAFAGAWTSLRAALVPARLAREGHWTERARHVYPATVLAGLVVIALPIALGYVAHRFTGGLSPIPPLLVGLLTLAMAFMGGYVAVWRLARTFRPNPLPLGRSLVEYFVWMSLQTLPLLAMIGLAVGAAPTSWIECVAVGLAVCLAGFLLHLGAGLGPGRWAGLIRPSGPRLAALVEAAAREASMPVPRVEEAELRMANAFALPLAGRLLYTTSLLDVMTDEEIQAITRHELAHLREPFRVRAARFAPIVALAFMAFAPGFLSRGQPGLATLFVIIPVVVFVSVATLARFWEKDADHQATHGAPSPAYARALEKLYEANLFPAVHGRKSHPDLYSRMEAAGVTPSFPKPPAPSPWRGFPSLLLGLSVAVGPVIGVALLTRSPESCVALDAPRCLGALAAEYEDEGRLDDAKVVFRAATELGPRDAISPSRLAFLEAGSGFCDEAQRDLLEARRRSAPTAPRADPWLKWVEYQVRACYARGRGEGVPFQEDEQGRPAR